MCYNPNGVKNMGNRKNDVDPFLHDASRALVDMAEQIAQLKEDSDEKGKLDLRIAKITIFLAALSTIFGGFAALFGLLALLK